MVIAPHYTIKNPDGPEKVNFLFNTRMFNQFAESKGLDFQGLLRYVQSTLNATGGFTIEDLRPILTTAHESYCFYNKETHSVSTGDVDLWIDWMGGPVRSLSAYGDIFIQFTAKLLGIDPKVIRGEVVQEEKKSESVTLQANP